MQPRSEHASAISAEPWTRDGQYYLQHTESLEAELAETHLLRDISAELIGEADSDALYQKLVAAAVAIMHSDFGCMQRVVRDEEGGNELALLVAHGFPEDACQRLATVTVETGTLCAKALQQRCRTVSADIARDERLTAQARGVYADAGIFAAQSTPLITRHGELIGMLSTHWHEPHQPSEHQLRLFDILARQAADLLERNDTHAALREREVWLAAQKEATQAALADAPLAESLGILARAVTAQLDDGVRAAFYIARNNGTTLHHVVGMDDAYARAIDGFRIGPDSLACGLAAATGQAILTADVREDPRWRPWLWLAEQFGYRGVWSFPIHTAGGSFLGTLALYWPTPHHATQHHRELIALLTQTAAIIISRDTEATERRRVEQALRQADRRKDEFIAVLAHELRNPLAPIHNTVEVLRRHGDDADAVAAAANMLERQVSHMVRLVNDLLDVSRISQDRIELHRERIALAPALYQAAEAARPLCDARRQQLLLELPNNPVAVDADAVRIVQLVSNLLANASKFSPHGSRVRLSLRQDANEARICVHDEGIGIAADQLERIFDLFVQADASLERAHGGLGIGLTLSRKLARLHGGEVEAHSDGPGKGSEFIVRLPLATAPRMRATAKPRRHSDLQPLRILLVDDNEDALAALTYLLESDGHQVIPCGNGATAVEEAARERPDVVLLDIGLPGLNGYEAAERIRAAAGDACPRLIALSGWGAQSDRRRSADAGFDDHLVKPVDYAALVGVLGKVGQG